MMRPAVLLIAAAGCLAIATPLVALRIDLSAADIDRALAVGRMRDSDRDRFHAPYIKAINTPFVERVEIISEFRRVVLFAEAQIARGDRLAAYSTTRASDALQVYRRRVAVRAQIRFHPLNNYVSVPPVGVALVGNDRALIGVTRDPVYGFAPEPDMAAPIMGAVVEGVFEAEALGQAAREFVVTLDRNELGRFTFDFATVE